MAEVERLAGGDELLDLLPDLAHGAVGSEHHDDIALLCGLFDGEQRLAGNPSILERTAPAGVRTLALALADNDVDTVVAHVKRLRRTLDSVTEHRDGLVLEDLLRLLERELLAGHNVFRDIAELYFHCLPFFSADWRYFCVLYHISRQQTSAPRPKSHDFSYSPAPMEGCRLPSLRTRRPRSEVGIRALNGCPSLPLALAKPTITDHSTKCQGSSAQGSGKLRRR